MRKNIFNFTITILFIFNIALVVGASYVHADNTSISSTLKQSTESQAFEGSKGSNVASDGYLKTTLPRLPALVVRRELNSSVGMAGNAVRAIMQDQKGFMWFGTWAGLSRYDGYEFKTYTHSPSNPKSLPNNTVSVITQTRNGTIWIGTVGGGLARFDSEHETFEKFSHDPNDPQSINGNIPVCITEDKDGYLWIGLWANGLDRFDPKSKTFKHFKNVTGSPDGLIGNSVTGVFEDNDGILWIMTQLNGLQRLNPKTGKFTQPKSFSEIGKSYWGQNVFASAPDGSVWFVTLDYLHHLNPKNNKITRYPAPEGAQLKGVLRQDNGNIWVIDELEKEALYSFDPINGKFQKHMSGTAFYAGLFDAHGNFWMGSNSGVKLIDVSPLKFTNIQWDGDTSRTNQSFHPYKLILDQQDNVWLLSNNGIFRTKAGSDALYKSEIKLPDTSSIPKAMEIDAEGFMWIGGDFNTNKQALFKFDPEFNSVVKAIKVPPNVFPAHWPKTYLLDIMQDQKNKNVLWLASNNGLVRFDREKNDFQFFSLIEGNFNKAENNIRKLAQDAEGNIWTGSWYGGISRFNTQTNRFDISLLNAPLVGGGNAASDISCLVVDGDGTKIWGATTSGLYQYDIGTGLLRLFNRASGLPVETFRSIAQDSHGDIWLGSTQGIVKFDKVTEKASLYSKKDAQMTSDLVQGTELGKDGHVYLATTNGLIKFKPSEIKRHPVDAAIQFTDSSLYLEANKTSSLKGMHQNIPVYQAKQIILPPGSRSVSIGFSLLDYRNPSLFSYRYRLLGVDENWIEAYSKCRLATFIKLAPGQYSLEVDATTGYEQDSVKAASINIIVLPAWWQTKWFKGSMLVLFFGILTSMFMVRNKVFKRFKSLAMFPDQSPHPIMRFDQNNELIYMNEATAFLQNFHPYAIGEKAPDDWLDTFLKVRSTGNSQEFEYSSNNQKYYANITVSPLKDSQEVNVYGYDITTRRKVEQQLQQAQKMDSIGNLAGGIAHDFNNILSPIIGMSELLLEDMPEGGRERGKVQIIYKAGKRAEDLVKQILTFSRQSDHKMTAVLVQNILQEVLKLGRSSIPSNIEIQENIDWSCGSIMADATQIHQVTMNLITNAFHAIEEKNGVIDITLKKFELKNDEIPKSLLPPGGYIQLSVADNGTGMPQSIQEKIFDPYFTTKKKGKGTGLGLAVVYGIIKKHNGDIKVYSEEGKGSTFNVYLPLIKTLAMPALENQSSMLPTGTEKILLVDDEILVANLEYQMLSRLGYHVTKQTNSLVALNEFKANPENFDLVISDMTMPDMTGDQLVKEILSIKPDMPIIICTGFSERVNKEQSEVLGAKGFLMKPIGKFEMAQMVRNVLDKAKKP